MPEANNTPEEIRERVLASVARVQPSLSDWRDANTEVGDIMPDGTIYAGISPNGRMYVTAENAPVRLDFNAAAKYTEVLDAHGHQDWYMPTREELNILYENRNKGALEGSFNSPAGLHWSSTSDGRNGAWAMGFNGDGKKDGCCMKDHKAAVRCVRYRKI